ncbi:dynamin-related 1E [Olea europaea subsp. europaea]|uniref:Dynamin-related 1E n=1 Tax=Olea europaea subsp. europaea TaxID=158383 RepID=A0A8S0U115_OLEEU|nr:dynamin-related 1E [Olea europaea subsp. europaea]
MDLQTRPYKLRNLELNFDVGLGQICNFAWSGITLDPLLVLDNPRHPNFNSGTRHLESIIRARIPSITSLINKSIDELESEMDHLGRPTAVDAGLIPVDSHMIINYLVHCFSRPCGDRISGIFDNQLPAALRKLPFDRHLSLQNVRKIV